MNRLPLWALSQPFLAAGVVAFLSVCFAFQIPRLSIDPSFEGLMVQEDPERRHYEQMKERFGSDNLSVVLIKGHDVFSASVLDAVRQMSDALEQLDGVRRVESLTTVTNLTEIDDTLFADALVPDTSLGTAELARIRADALADRILVGNIVSRDARATAINIYADARPTDKEFSQRFSEQVDEIIRAGNKTGLTAYQIGIPFAKATYARYIRHETPRLIPVAIAAALTIVLLAFRTLQAAVIPLLTGGLSIVWTLGLMALFGLPLTPLTSMIPSLLITVGLAEDIHMLCEYQRRLRAGDDKLAAIGNMLRISMLPVCITTLTTVVGFGSLIATDITMLIQFGCASAMGLAVNLVVTLLVLPVALRAWPVPPGFRRTVPNNSGAPNDLTSALATAVVRLGEFSIRRAGWIAAGAAVALAGSVAGWFSLRVDNDFIRFFFEGSTIRQRVQDLHDSLAGAIPFYIIVETHREDGMKDPELLRKIAGLQDFLAGTGQIDKSVSLVDYMKKMHRVMNGGNAVFETIPQTREEVAQYLLTLDGSELAHYVDFDASTANVIVRHNITSSSEFSALLRRVDAFVRSTFPPQVSVRYTGETILVNNAADFMAVNELTSFSLTFIVIGLVHTFLFQSVRGGVLSLIPTLIPVLTSFGFMGLLGIPLNVGTAMVASIAIGIVVDNTVHHMVTFSRQLRVHRDRRLAMLETIRAQARPIVCISLALAGGFLVLIFSNFVPTAQFGALSALVMAVAMVGEFMLTPILMYWTRGRVPVREPVFAARAQTIPAHRSRDFGGNRWTHR